MNPSTRLPGTVLIERAITQRVKKGEEFAACYVDLDNFKAYNDHYGYVYADSMILMTSKIIREIVYGEIKNGFVGHIGGDDFIFIIPIRKVKQICSKIIEIFDRMVVSKYEEEDLMHGYIITKNRKGEKEKFPIMTISIAVVVNKKRMFSHIGQISRMITDLKNYAKSLPGSNYVIERRKRY
jgi:diguanylate cyclase (GGDEF)-like protein